MSKHTRIVTAAATLALVAGLALGRSNAGQPPARIGKHRIVFHVNVDQEEHWQEVLNNVENVQKAFGAENVEIEVVAHGAGIGLLQRKNGALLQRVEKIAQTGPIFAACNNTIRKRELTPADLDPSVKIVDSGVAELVRRQEEGWTYVKLSY